MNKFKIIVLLLLLSHESSASLMQLEYRNFYAPPSPTNWPVDMTGVVSFIFDNAVEDIDANPFDGKFLNPIKSGYMFLSGIRYDIDIDMPIEFITHYSPRSFFRATGSIFNSELAKRDSFDLYLGGDFLAEDMGVTLANLDLASCYENHLLISSEVVESYESGSVSTDVASVPEPGSTILLSLGLASILLFRKRVIKASAV
ncbi:MAG: PEP-CTERM sorting domain-containing protein [Pseudomonadota bacterium]